MDDARSGGGQHNLRQRRELACPSWSKGEDLRSSAQASRVRTPPLVHGGCFFCLPRAAGEALLLLCMWPPADQTFHAGPPGGGSHLYISQNKATIDLFDGDTDHHETTATCGRTPRTSTARTRIRCAWRAPRGRSRAAWPRSAWTGASWRVAAAEVRHDRVGLVQRRHGPALLRQRCNLG